MGRVKCWYGKAAQEVIGALIIGGWCAMPAHAEERTDFRAAFAHAIDSRSGVVNVEVKGPILRSMQAELQTDARIFMEVRTVQSFPQEGCKRLKVTFFAPDSRLPTKDGGTAPLRDVGFALNMCRDGNPPNLVSARLKQ